MPGRRISEALVAALALTLAFGPRAVMHAQAARSSQPSSVQKVLFGLEHDWAQALVRRDTAAFRRLTAPGFVYTEDNVEMNQNELLHAIATSPDKIESAVNEQMKIHDYSPVVVITGLFVVKGRTSGKSFINRYRFTDIWLYRNGRWQAIAAQDYLIPK